MSLQQVDDVLRVWKVRLSAMAGNLLELQCDAAYQSLTGTGGLDRARITGETERRAGPALRQMNGLFQQFGALQSMLDRAEELRRGLPAVFGAESRLRELNFLLFGPSVEAVLPTSSPQPAHLLLPSESPRKVSPEELLAAMTHTFATVRQAVTEVGEAWLRASTRVEVLLAEAQTMRSQTVLPSHLVAPALGAVEGRLEELLRQAKVDPLGAASAVDRDVEANLAALRQRLAGALRLCEQLHAARVTLQSLYALHHEAQTKSAALPARVQAAGQAGPGQVDQKAVDALGPWLGRLERRAAEGLQQAVGVGLQRWRASADACMARSREVIGACDRALASRAELRGRLAALEAKARACGLASMKQVTVVCRKAEEILYTGPVDLQEATQLLLVLEKHLRGAQPAVHVPVGAR